MVSAFSVIYGVCVICSRHIDQNVNYSNLALATDIFGGSPSNADETATSQGEARITIAVLQSQLDVSVLPTISVQIR